MSGADIGQQLAASLWSFEQKQYPNEWSVQKQIRYQISKVWSDAINLMEERDRLLRLLAMEDPDESNQYDLYQYLEVEWDPETKTLKPKPFA